MDVIYISLVGGKNNSQVSDMLQVIVADRNSMGIHFS